MQLDSQTHLKLTADSVRKRGEECTGFFFSMQDTHRARTAQNNALRRCVKQTEVFSRPVTGPRVVKAHSQSKS